MMAGRWLSHVPLHGAQSIIIEFNFLSFLLFPFIQSLAGKCSHGTGIGTSTLQRWKESMDSKGHRHHFLQSYPSCLRILIIKDDKTACWIPANTSRDPLSLHHR